MRTLLILLAMAGGTFDVATLKRSPPPSGDSYQILLGSIRNGRVELKNVNLSDCVKFAFGLVSDDQIAGPEWIKSKTVLFDIVAQTSPDTTREDVMPMMQSLLAERLKLTWHHEQKELRYLALVPGKNGLKMRSADAVPAADQNNSGGHGNVRGNRVSMLLLATLLSRLEHQIVVDNTGLKGFYEINLQWTPDSGRPTVDADTAPAGTSLFTAVQEQLGLRLESRKGPLDIVAIAHAEQVPAEN